MNDNTAKIQHRLSKNILRLREQRNWSQEEFADQADVAVAYLSRVERKLVNITLRNLVKLADGLGVDVVELLKPIR